MAKILLDIDGVLNPLGFLDKHPAVDTFDLYSEGWTQWIISPSYHKPMLEEFLRNGHTIIWISTWLNASNNYCKAAGLEDFSYIDISIPKFETLIDYIKNRPDEHIVIIEDELTDEELNAINSYDNVYACRPDLNIGYVQEDHDRVMSFLSHV